MIKIASVYFPKDLYNSFKENNVVVFAGAGVSMGEPSGLPSFSKLADDIAERIGEKPMCRDKSNPLYKPIDLFLDELSSANKTAINKRAAEILNDRYKKPNDLHLNIIRLFKDTQNIRIVTTNFDRLFTKAFHKVYGKNAKLKIYSNPALPSGGDFNGIVHLHGSLAEPEHMVLTRTHFGRAYLTNGSARRFLLPLFQKYTVLFIGYSLDDVVMDYLQRALPHETTKKRYILTESKADDNYKWKSLGVEPIRFEKNKENENHYSNLYELVDKLANRLNWSLIDWEDELSSYCSQHPDSLEAEAMGEVIEALESRDIVATFSHVNKNEEWIQWLYERGKLNNLFKEIELNKIDRSLGVWVSKFSNTHPELLAELMKKARYHLNSWFWTQLLRMMGKDVEVTNREQFSTLLQNLLSHAPSKIHNPLVLILLAKKLKRLNDSLGLYQILPFLLTHSTFLKEKQSSVNSNTEDKPIKYNVAHNVTRFPEEFLIVWDECFVNNGKIDKEVVFQIILSKFNALGIEAMLHEKSIYYTVERKTIEKNVEKHEKSPLDVLVDFIRDYMFDLDYIGSDLFFKKVILLLESPFSILKRIAIDSLLLTKRIKSKEKFDLVLSKVKIDDWDYRFELLSFFRDNFPSLDPSEQDDYVKLIDETYKNKYEDKNKEEYYWAVFDWLEWLDRRPHESKALKDLLSIIREKYPDMEPKEYPGYSFDPIEVIDASNSPLTEQQFKTITDEKFLYYMPYLDDNLAYMPYRDSVPNVSKSVGSQKPDWGIEKFDFLSEINPTSDDVFLGIDNSHKTNLNLEQLLNSCSSNVLVEKFPEQFLDKSIEMLKSKELSLSINILISIDSIVERIWEMIENEESPQVTLDWFTSSINSISGRVAEYWIIRYQIDVDNNKDQAISQIEKYHNRFVGIIKGNTSREKLARPVLCNAINLLYFYDYEWVKNNLIPLFESSDDDVFRQAWEGFLFTFKGGLSNELVIALHDSLIKAFKRVNIIHDHIRTRFLELYAYIVVHYFKNPVSDWINPLLNAGNNQLTIEFAEQLRHTIHQLKPEDRQLLWVRWYKTFLENRKDNIPVVQLDEEIVSYLNGIIDFDFAFREIVDLVTRFKRINIGNLYIFFDLTDEDKWLSYVEEVTDLLIYLADCNVEEWQKTEFKNVIEKFNIMSSEKFPILDNKLRRHGIFIKEIS